MNKKRTVSIRHSQLIRFRNALRDVILRAKHIEVMKLLDAQEGLEPTESRVDMKKIKVFNDKRSKLERAWNKSICVCPSCGSRTSNMKFNPSDKTWFCVSCYQHHHDFYIEKARKGEVWYDGSGEPSTKWYP